MKNLKKYLSLIFAILGILFILSLFIFRGNLNSYVSKMVKEQGSAVEKDSVSGLVNDEFNYEKNAKKYQFTFLEFGAKGCSACKRMELVMAEMKQKYPDKVNVIFYNILLPENQAMMRAFGIAEIPTQVLLNKTGKEFFRHSGYYSTDEIIKQLQNYGLQ